MTKILMWERSASLNTSISQCIHNHLEVSRESVCLCWWAQWVAGTSYRSKTLKFQSFTCSLSPEHMYYQLFDILTPCKYFSGWGICRLILWYDSMDVVIPPTHQLIQPCTARSDTFDCKASTVESKEAWNINITHTSDQWQQLSSETAVVSHWAVSSWWTLFMRESLEYPVTFMVILNSSQTLQTSPSCLEPSGIVVCSLLKVLEFSFNTYELSFDRQLPRPMSKSKTFLMMNNNY